MNQIANQIRQRAADFEQFARYYQQATGQAWDSATYSQKLFDFMEWRTLGAQEGADGKKHGGFRAQIDTRDGTIHKTKVKGLEGKNVRDIGDHFKHQESKSVVAKNYVDTAMRFMKKTQELQPIPY